MRQQIYPVLEGLGTEEPGEVTLLLAWVLLACQVGELVNM